MTAVYEYYLFEELMTFLKNRDLSHFHYCIGEACMDVCTDEDVDISITADTSDGRIPEETVDQMIDVLEHLDECVEKAYVWLKKLNLQNDRWFPFRNIITSDMDTIFAIDALHFGEKYGGSHKKMRLRDGFSITFALRGDDFYPVGFIVKFYYKDLYPFAAERYVW